MSAADTVAAGGRRWNHNIHYYPLIMSAVPDGCHRALDVGCGEGMLARQLARVVPQVAAIDADAPVLELARRQDPAREVAFIRGDFLAYPFRPGSFGMITSVAALHHMDATAALARMDLLLAPGGVLAVVGLARPDLPGDLPREAVSIAAGLGYRLTRKQWHQPAPTQWPPPHSYAGMRLLAHQALPGVRYRRHLLWRYSLLWSKPLGAE